MVCLHFKGRERDDRLPHSKAEQLTVKDPETDHMHKQKCEGL